jgi:hypothetical protein
MKEDSFEKKTILDSIENTYKNSLSIIKDIFELFKLEVKLAGRSLAIIVMLIVVTSLLLLATWFSLLGALVAWMVSFHLSVIQSFLIVSAINLFIAFLIGFYIARISKNLKLQETRKQLRKKL